MQAHFAYAYIDGSIQLVTLCPEQQHQSQPPPSSSQQGQCASHVFMQPYTLLGRLYNRLTAGASIVSASNDANEFVLAITSLMIAMKTDD